MKTYSARTYQAIVESLPLRANIVVIDDVFSVATSYLAEARSETTLLALSQQLTMDLPASAIDSLEIFNRSVSSQCLVSNDEAAMDWHATVASLPGASRFLGKQKHRSTIQLDDLFEQLSTIGLIHLGGCDEKLINDAIEKAHDEQALCIVYGASIEHVNLSPNSAMYFDDSLTELGEIESVQTDYLLIVPRVPKFESGFVLELTESLTRLVPADFARTRLMKNESISHPATLLPKCGFYNDIKDGNVWSQPNTENIILFKPNDSGLVTLQIELSDFAHDLNGKNMMVVVGNNPIQTVAVSNLIELRCELEQGAITPIVFIVETWSYLEDHDRWVGIAVNSIAELSEGGFE